MADISARNRTSTAYEAFRAEAEDEDSWADSPDRPGRAPGFAQRALLLSLAADLQSPEQRKRLYERIVQRKRTADYYMCQWDPGRADKDAKEAAAYASLGRSAPPRPAYDLARPVAVPFLRLPVVFRKASEIWRSEDEFVVGFGPELERLRLAVTVLDDPAAAATELRETVERVRGWLTQSSPHLNRRLEFGPVGHLNFLAAAYYGLAARQLSRNLWLECLECGAVVRRSSNKQVFCTDACRKRFARHQEKAS